MSELPPAPSIRIEIISDVTCPWCYIGKHRLEAAIASYAGLDVELHWQPFQLDPNVPAEGIDLRAYAVQLEKGQTVETQQARASKAGKEFGLTFAWDKITRMPNTRDAHRLIQHALLYGKQTKMVERLFKAYFCEGVDIGDRSRLIELAEDCGLDSYSIEHLFGQNEDILAIEEKIATARHFNLPNVPFFVFDDDIVVPGAASLQLFRAALFEAQKTPRPQGTH